MEMRQPSRQAGRILGGLPFDAGQREAFRLGFDRAQGLGVGVEKIISEAGLQGELTHGHAAGRGNVHFAGRLNRPPCLVKLIVDLFAGFLFGRHGLCAVTVRSHLTGAKHFRRLHSVLLGLREGFPRPFDTIHRWRYVKACRYRRFMSQAITLPPKCGAPL